MLAPRARTAAFAVLAFLALASPSSHADAAADALVEEGVSLREQGRDEEALERFRRAYAIEPSARARAQIALAEQALGRWVEAERDLLAALAHGTDRWIVKHEVALRGALATIAKHVGDVVIVGGVPGAEVRIDGVRQGVLPLTEPLRLEAGTHTLEVEAPGYYPVSRPVTVGPASPARVSLDMHRRSAAPSGVPAELPPPTPASADPAEPRSAGVAQHVVGLSLAGASLVGVGVGIGALVARGDRVSAYNDDPACPPIEQVTRPAACQGHVDAARTWEVAAAVGFVAGGAFLVAGAITFFTAKASGDGAKGRAGLMCAPGAFGATCRLEF
jgi:hypothetical protein